MRRLWLQGLAYTLMGALSVVLLSAGGVAFTNGWVHWSGARYAHGTLDDVPARAVAIVPGTGGKNGKVAGYFLPRMLAALTLYRTHKVTTILVSGIGGNDGDGNEVSAAYHWLRERGVPEADILLDHAGHRTLDTMLRARHVFHIDQAIICSQNHFLDRALFLGRAAGMDAVGFLAHGPYSPDDNAIRQVETAKRALAFVDTYLVHRGPRVAAPESLLAVGP